MLFICHLVRIWLASKFTFLRKKISKLIDIKVKALFGAICLPHMANSFL
jgi:hypothetical protein